MTSDRLHTYFSHGMHVFCADDAWGDGYVSARSPRNEGGRRDLTGARSRAPEPAGAAAGERSAGGGNLPLRIWVWAIYLETMNLKGVSSMKIHRDLGITQKTAWHLQHRIRTAFLREFAQFTGPVEVDETYIGGLEKNRS